jgi:hypothetical protein
MFLISMPPGLLASVLTCASEYPVRVAIDFQKTLVVAVDLSMSESHKHKLKLAIEFANASLLK